MEEPLISIGEILGAHGLRGELKVKALTDFPERFFRKDCVTLHDPSGRLADSTVRFLGAREVKNRIVLKLEGCDTPEKAKELYGCLFQIPRREVRPLPEGSFYHFELAGLEVLDEEGARLGTLVEILTTGANDVYRVQGEEVHLVPALKKVVRSVDLAARRMIVSLDEMQ